MSTIRVRAKEIDGVVEVRALITHPMETGQRKGSDGELIPAHYITDVEVTSGETMLMVANWGGSVSTNPYLAFNYKGKAGDKITVMWKDNKGESDTVETEVS